MPAKKLHPAFGFVLLAVIVAVAVGATWKSGLFDAIAEARRPPYASVQGKVETVDAAYVRPRRGSTYYLPKVTYSFEVAGQRYAGDAVGEHARNLKSLRGASKERVLESFKPGKVFTVMYDPSDPAQSYMVVPGQQPEPAGWFPIVFMAGLDLLVLGLVVRVAWWARRYVSSSPPPAP